MTTETKIELGATQPPVKKKKRGPGRPVKSKTQRIRELSNAGFTPKQIAAKTGVSVQQVYVVRHTEKRRKEKELASKYKWSEPKLLPMPEDTPAIKPNWPLPVAAGAPKPTFWQRVKAVFFPQ